METAPFFPARPALVPTVYAYQDTRPETQGMLKVGYTTQGAAARVAQQYPTKGPGGAAPYTIVLEVPAMRPDGSTFTDHDVHRALARRGFKKQNQSEWFRCTVDDVKAAIVAVIKGYANEENRTQRFGLRPEQQAAIERTRQYFAFARSDRPGIPPKFLWNAKMRFGKTFTTYQLAKAEGWKRLLVLTFKPAVLSAWEEDLRVHIDFEGWQFISRSSELSYETADKSRPIVCFASLQDFLGRTKEGGIKLCNEWAHAVNWDCVVFDEYHFGAWRENTRDLFLSEEKEADYEVGLFASSQQTNEKLKPVGMQDLDENTDILPLTTHHYLYLSGTPFKAIAWGEFSEEQIFNWTYSDEQRAKAAWPGPGPNPYAALPKMVLMTYQLPDEVAQVARGGEFDSFDLDAFFAATGEGPAARFVHEEEVQKWLDMIRGAYNSTDTSALKQAKEKPVWPYSDIRLLPLVAHTFWFLPNVASCFAMRNLLAQRQNQFYHDYTVVVAAGNKAGLGVKALPPVLEAMHEPLKSKSITLSCGKLTTGVTVKPWGGIFMLRDTSSPETYFQAAFRVQSPWTMRNPEGTNPNEEVIVKPTCYVFDFAPNRALRQIADYSTRLSQNEGNPEKNVAEFIQFLPVLAYDGSSMTQLDAQKVLDMAMSGTTATMLARRWESALLVNVDNQTLKRLMENPQAMAALMRIEGFRSLNEDIETIINKTESVKAAKKKSAETDEGLSEKEKKQMTDEEKEYKSKRKEIQEKLIKFATRIPVFMYLTDYREFALKDVITKLEPELFRKVTGITKSEFELLVSLGLFNRDLMNDAVYKFKRYEDASLSYTGLYRYEHRPIGLFDTQLEALDR